MMLALLLFLSLFISNVLSETDPVLVVIGDSWGAFGWQSLQNVLSAHGSNLKVVSYAIGGTTSSFWARDPNLVNLLVSENPTAQYLWLSIGGNDVIEFMPLCTQQHTVDYCIDEIVPIVLNNTQTFLDPLTANHPNLKLFPLATI